MNNGYQYRSHDPIQLDELSELVKKSGSPTWRLQEKIDELEFEKVDKEWLDNLSKKLWSQGMVFGPQSDIRWWKVDEDRYDTLLLSEAKIDLSSSIWYEIEMEISEYYLIYLWGERKSKDPYWIETRIPRPLSYPIDEEEWQRRKSDYVAIRACDYKNNGVVQFTRLLGLQLINKSQGGVHV